jgi:hypothetical protein
MRLFYFFRRSVKQVLTLTLSRSCNFISEGQFFISNLKICILKDLRHTHVAKIFHKINTITRSGVISPPESVVPFDLDS